MLHPAFLTAAVMLSRVLLLSGALVMLVSFLRRR